MNLLITCAGRRHYLVEYFRQALAGSGLVYAADMSPYAPALRAADRTLPVPSVEDPDYVSILLGLCQANGIGLLLSVNDTELLLLARNKELFSVVGTRVVVSSPEFIGVCADKLSTADFLSRTGLDAPRTFERVEEAIRLIDEGELHFPLLVKARFGSASLAVETVRDRSELTAALTLGEGRIARSAGSVIKVDDGPFCGLVIQEFLAGQEYGLDICNDLDGRHVCTAVKKKLTMRAGETDRAVTVRDSRLEALGGTLGRASGHVGVLDCDVIVAGERACVIDMNPRFGGGYPFSHVAGLNMPAAILAWSRGDEPLGDWLTYTSGVAAAKCDILVRVGETAPSV
jgi:carbamoyl-phosphate synthase large subunit